MQKTTLGFIGAGHMNSAILNGLQESDHPFKLLLSSRDMEKAQKTAKKYKAQAENNKNLIAQSDIIIIGVKPQQMHDLLEEIKNEPLDDKIIITLAAGLAIEDYQKILGEEKNIIRAMPNIAAHCQASLTGIYSPQILNEQEEETIETIFSSIGSIAWLDDEIQLDGLTALSGSGIAYFLRLMQAMSDAAERYGFEKEELHELLSLTIAGASSLVLEDKNKQSFADWVKKIAVPQGTTEAAMKALDKKDFNQSIEEAMQAVVERSQALRETLSKDW